MGGFGDDVLNYLDDHVLDQVDSATGGVIDVDFDNGAFTAGVGVDDFLGVGVGISGDGVTVSSDGPLLGVNVGVTDSHGTTVLFDENIDGVEVPAGADVGFGLDADGGAGVIAGRWRTSAASPSGSPATTTPPSRSTSSKRSVARRHGRRRPTCDERTDRGSARVSTSEDERPLHPLLILNTISGTRSRTAAQCSKPRCPSRRAGSPSPKPQSDFSQDLEQVDQQQDAADDVWDDL